VPVNFKHLILNFNPVLMPFIIYGSYGFLGDIITNLAVNSGLRPILAGRDVIKLEQQATGLSLEYRVFGLDNPGIIDQAFKNIKVVLNCAGPYIYTHKPIVEACLRNKAHYLDLTGEIPPQDFRRQQWLTVLILSWNVRIWNVKISFRIFFRHFERLFFRC
jgi:short subunit dehydrogenase-like uncharacterized protein